MKELVEEGDVPMSRIDDAVRRVLRMKYRLGLFGGGSRFHASFVQRTPYTGHNGCQYNYEERIERLYPGGRHFPTEDCTVGLFGSKKSERSTCLFVGCPEEYNEESDNVNNKDTVTPYLCQRAVQQNADGEDDTGCEYPYTDPIVAETPVAE